MFNRLTILISLCILSFCSIGFAQEAEQNDTPADPFQVVRIESRKLSSEEICKITQDSIAIMKDDFFIQDHRIINYRYKGSWYQAELESVHSDNGGDVNYNYSVADIDRDGMNDLLIKTTSSFYGSGGGTTQFFASIYKFDTVVSQLFDTQLGEADEMFAREYNKGANYYRKCLQNVTIERGEITISTVKKSGWENDVPKDRTQCISYIKPGRYTIVNGAMAAVPIRKQKNHQH